MSDRTYTVVCQNILHKASTVELKGTEHEVAFEKDKERGVAVAREVPGAVASALTDRAGFEVADVDYSTEDALDELTKEKVSVIDGIGDSTEETLAEAGVPTVFDLADSDAESLAERTGLGEERLAGWIEAAQERL